MNKNSPWHWIILAALVTWSLATVLPIDQKVTLGLDLQGGTSFILQVKTEGLDADAREDAPRRALEVIRNRVDELGGREPSIFLEPNSQRIVVQIPGLDTERREQAKTTLQRAAFLEFKLVHEDNEDLVDAWLGRGEAPVGYRAVDVGPDRFLVRDPGSVPEGTSDRQLRQMVRSFRAPPNTELMLRPFERQGADLFEPVYVLRRRELSGEYLQNAGAQQDFSTLVPAYVVTLQFDAAGTRRFRQLTTDYAPNGQRNPSPIGRRLAIILDGSLYSAPTLQTPIYDGNAQISGNFSLPEAQELALVLRAGSLPAEIEILEERTVDPSLGRDSIESGKKAVLFGGIAVILFMLIYYMRAGIIADLALLLDLVLLPLGMLVAAGFLGLFTGAGQWAGPMALPTLTLAGIAGIVLTIGMAVDANVLIFERIREEQKLGKSLRSSIEAGYDKVFSTILDANVTTLITGVILFWQGSGPIRGFAITLTAGIMVSMYVALVVTRMFFNATTKRESKPLRMLSVLGETKIDFLAKRKIAAVISVVLIGLTATLFVQRGVENFGVDFTGGTSVTLEFQQEARPEVADIRDLLEGNDIRQPLLQYQRNLTADAQGVFNEFLEMRLATMEDGERAADLLAGQFPDAQFRVTQMDTVGPQIGRELRRRGVMSIIWAMVAIVIYISLRFEFGFAIGAIVAILHDVLITVGIYTLLGRQLSLPIVAALLTIVGYSVNDTIVVFDRIREGMKLHKGMKYLDVANLSINQTLSRTLLTSATTLLTVVILLVFGGGAINDFALALFIGVLVGTYSSIFVATPVTLFWHKDLKAGAEPVPAKAAKAKKS